METHGQLKDEDKSKEAITDTFLAMFAEVVKPHWSLLAPYIISYNYDVTEENILQQLRTWSKEKKPTYGDLHEILKQVIIDPVVIPQEDILKGTVRCSHLFVLQSISFNICILMSCCR